MQSGGKEKEEKKQKDERKKEADKKTARKQSRQLQESASVSSFAPSSAQSQSTQHQSVPATSSSASSVPRNRKPFTTQPPEIRAVEASKASAQLFNEGEEENKELDAWNQTSAAFQHNVRLPPQPNIDGPTPVTDPSVENYKKFFEGPITDHQSWKASVKKRNGRKGELSPWRFLASLGSQNRSFGWLPSSQINQDQAKKIAAELIKALVRFPGSVDTITTDASKNRATPPFRDTLLNAAARKIVPGFQRELSLPCISGASFKIRFSYVDANTCQEIRAAHGEKLNSRTPLLRPPRVYNVRWMHSASLVPVGKDTNGFDVEPSVIPTGPSNGASQAVCRAMEAALKALACHFTGRVMTKEGLELQKKKFLLDWAPSSIAPGPQTSNLLRAIAEPSKMHLFSSRNQPQSFDTVIEPTLVAKDLFKAALGSTAKAPYIRIHSMNRYRALQVLQAGSQVFGNTSNIVHTWETMSKQASVVNAQIANCEPAPNICHGLDEAEERFTEHACSSCAQLSLCADMKRSDFILKICETCSAVNKRTRRRNELAVTFKIYKLYMSERKSGCKEEDPSSDPKNLEAITAIRAELKAMLPTQPDAFYNGYHQMNNRPELQQISADRTRAFEPSVHTVFPFGLLSGKPAKHCSGNLAITKTMENFAKWVHLPGFLHELAIYLVDLRSIDGDSSAVRRLRRRFMEKCARLREIRSEIAVLYPRLRQQFKVSHKLPSTILSASV